MTKRYDYIVKDLRALKLDFRINDLDESLEVKMGQDDWGLLDDTKLAIIEMELEELGYGVRGKKKPPQSSAKRAWVKLADNQRYNPILDYFTALEGKYMPMREGSLQTSPQPYVIPAFAEAYFTNPDGFLGVWLFRWMVGAIAKAFEQARNPMLVIIGPQRMGKSRFAQWLCPLPDRFREGKIDPDSKDSRLRLMDTFIQEVAELGSTTRRADVEALKDHITKINVSDRLPYGRMPITKPAICSFIGSVNFDGAGFLNDPTGSTRFLSTQIDRIDFSYSKDVDVANLWAEAYYFYRNADRAWELTSAEKKKQAEINEQFEVVSILEDIIDQHMDITLDETNWVPVIDVKNHLALHYRAPNDDYLYKRISQILTKKGCIKRREPKYEPGQPHRRAWFGCKLRQNEK